jgi:hypothetical protein
VSYRSEMVAGRDHLTGGHLHRVQMAVSIEAVAIGFEHDDGIAAFTGRGGEQIPRVPARALSRRHREALSSVIAGETGPRSQSDSLESQWVDVVFSGAHLTLSLCSHNRRGSVAASSSVVEREA